jgi:hypothetical protein
MDSVEIQNRLRAEPFEPFRAVTASGETFDFPIPKAAFVTRHIVYVGVDFEDGIPEEFRTVAPERIVRLEPMPAHSSAG